jgi:hypothetical protein
MGTALTYSDKLTERRYPYSGVEGGLIAALDIDDAWRTQFRARIKHFRRLGVIGEQSHRGAAIRYSFEHAAKLAIVFLLADVGLDPVLSAQLINKHWGRSLRRRVQQAISPGTRDGENPWFLTLRMAAMRGPWAKQSGVAAIGAFQRIHRRPPLSEEQREALKTRVPEEHYEAWLAHWREPQENVGMWLDHPEERNFCVLSLSHVLHRLQDHLDGHQATPDATELHGHPDAGGE